MNMNWLEKVVIILKILSVSRTETVALSQLTTQFHIYFEQDK